MSRSFTERRVVLVGGAGFVGHHLALHLKNAGAHVHVIDDFAHNNFEIRRAFSLSQPADEGHRSILRERLELLDAANIPLHKLDASDSRALSAVLADIEPSVLVHLAGISSAELTEISPRSALDCGLKSLVNCLEFSDHSLDRFVYFSSSMVYGNFQGAEADELHPATPINVYGAMKLVGERLVQACGRKSDLPFVIVRPSALYGPRCVNRRIVQRLLTQAIHNIPLTIAGDGSELLDFTYVTDLIDGICLAIERPEAIQQVFNITFGMGRTLLELVDVIRNYFPAMTATYCEQDRNKPHRGTLSIRKAMDLLGYMPAFDLERGIPAYLEWMQPGVTRQAYSRRRAAGL